jgi:hemin uptake protein HemP
MNMKPPVVVNDGPQIPPTSDTTDTLGMPELLVQVGSVARATWHCSPRTLESRELFGDQNVVLIKHLGEVYRLQTTRQGKLIMTK